MPALMYTDLLAMHAYRKAVQCSAVAAKRCGCRLITHTEHPLRWIDRGNIKAALSLQLTHTEILPQHIMGRDGGGAVHTGSDLPCQQISGVYELPKTGFRAAVLQLGHMCKYRLFFWGVFLSVVSTAQYTAFDTHGSASKHKLGPCQTVSIMSRWASRKLPCFSLRYARLLLMTAPPAG